MKSGNNKSISKLKRLPCNGDKHCSVPERLSSVFVLALKEIVFIFICATAWREWT